MRSVFKDEMDLIWTNYERIIKQIGFKGMMLSSQLDLIQKFTLNYKNLYFQVKDINEYLGKTREEISYAELKLRRLIALWKNGNVWKIEGGISYKSSDKYQQFPLFNCQRPGIVPMPKTITKLQAKCLHQYIEDYNQKSVQDASFAKGKTRYIRNLRDLRNVLMAQEKMDEKTANKIIKLYGSAVAKKEVNDFSNDSIDFIK